MSRTHVMPRVIFGLVSGSLLVFCIAAAARAAPASDQWPSLSLPAFVAEAAALLAPSQNPSAELQDAVAAHAAERLRALAPDAQVAYEDVLPLDHWAKAKLAAAEEAALAPRLALPLAEAAGWTFDALQRVESALSATDAPAADRSALAAKWLEGHGTVESLSLDIRQSAWLANRASKLAKEGQAAAAAGSDALRRHVAALGSTCHEEESP